MSAIKTIKSNQVSYLRVYDLHLGMLTPDGMVLAVDIEGRRYRTPLGWLLCDPMQVVAVFARVTEDMVEETIEVTERERHDHDYR